MKIAFVQNQFALDSRKDMPSTQSAISIRPLEPADLPAALAIQSEIYPSFLRENRAAFASRLDFPTSYCLAATRSL